MDDCEHSVILDYFSRKYFNMRDSVEVVDTLSGKTIRVDNDQYIRIQDLILKLDMLFIEDPYKCRVLMDILDIAYLSCFDEPAALDISTVRKKLAEYAELGLIENEKCGRELYYERSRDEVDLEAWRDAVSFFAETNQIGVVGSFIEDKFAAGSSVFSYKHHYLLLQYW